MRWKHYLDFKLTKRTSFLSNPTNYCYHLGSWWWHWMLIRKAKAHTTSEKSTTARSKNWPVVWKLWCIVPLQQRTIIVTQWHRGWADKQVICQMLWNCLPQCWECRLQEWWSSETPFPLTPDTPDHAQQVGPGNTSEQVHIQCESHPQEPFQGRIPDGAGKPTEGKLIARTERKGRGGCRSLSSKGFHGQ